MRKRDADEFYQARIFSVAEEDRSIARQAYANLLWNKQFYHYDVQVGKNGWIGSATCLVFPVCVFHKPDLAARRSVAAAATRGRMGVVGVLRLAINIYSQ